MRKSFICVLACMTLLVVMASCNGNGSSNEVSKLQDSIAALKAQLNNTSKVENRERVKTSSSQSNEQKSLEVIPGTYTFTDKLGDKWTLILNEDNSGKLEKGDFVAYCSWKDYRRINAGIDIKFAADKPTIWFEKGEESIWITTIIDGYIYASNSIASTKDPNWRLPITKIE